MRRLILVKHSLPVIEPTLPASQWRLGPEGRRRCERLAALLSGTWPTHIVTSP